MHIHLHTYTIPIRRAIGPGRVRSSAMTSDPLPSFIVYPPTPAVNLGGPQRSRQLELSPPESDLENHQSHFRGPAKST